MTDGMATARLVIERNSTATVDRLTVEEMGVESGYKDQP